MLTVYPVRVLGSVPAAARTATPPRMVAMTEHSEDTPNPTQALDDRVNNRSHRPNSKAFRDFVASGWDRTPLHAEALAAAGFTPAVVDVMYQIPYLDVGVLDFQICPNTFLVNYRSEKDSDQGSFEAWRSTCSPEIELPENTMALTQASGGGRVWLYDVATGVFSFILFSFPAKLYHFISFRCFVFYLFFL